MEIVNIDMLQNSSHFKENIRLDVTPKIFLDPDSGPGSEPVDVTYGYMLYVDVINDRPALVIMQLKKITSKTVGYVYDLPEELLKEAMQCSSSECISGMYPLSEKLEAWLKQEFGVG